MDHSHKSVFPACKDPPDEFAFTLVGWVLKAVARIQTNNNTSNIPGTNLFKVLPLLSLIVVCYVLVALKLFYDVRHKLF
jgi:hypothetical protein